MHILVTGAIGFIGINLCKRLLDDGHSVTGIDNFYSSNSMHMPILNCYENFRFVRHDITEALPHDIESVDVLCNLACPASPKQYLKDPLYTMKTSILGTLAMLEYATKRNIPILQASTSEVYGDSLTHPQHEEYWGHVNPVGLRACYDEGKRAAESLCFDFVRMHQTCVKVIRVFNTYGPYMQADDGRVLGNFIMQALNKKPLTVYGDGLQTRSFCFVDDLVRGIILFLLMPCENTHGIQAHVHGPMNLGNPHEITINELVLYVKKHYPDLVVEHKPLPQDDPKQRKPDITRAKKVLGWNPEISLEEGIKRTIEWFSATYTAKLQNEG